MNLRILIAWLTLTLATALTVGEKTNRDDPMPDQNPPTPRGGTLPDSSGGDSDDDSSE